MRAEADENQRRAFFLVHAASPKPEGRATSLDLSEAVR